MASFFTKNPCRILIHVLIPISIYLVTQSCVTRRVSRELLQVEQAKTISPKRQYLKVHLGNGDLYVLHSWQVNETTQLISGLGNHLDFNRRIIESRGATQANKKATGSFQPFQIPFKEIVVVETNDRSNNPGVAAIIITGLATVPLALHCLANPKACFGSCPTFYVQKDSVSKLVGEGFSASISRSLEERDIDLINFPLNEGQPVHLIMKNEALETHLVRSLNLLVAEKQPENRVIQEVAGHFYEVSHLKPPAKAWCRSGSVLQEVSKKDTLEWYSLADSNNLAKSEDIFLEFENPGGETALIIDNRQSLMTTYLFYHSLSLTGNATSFYMTEMETRRPWLKKRISRMYDLLGGIEVAVLNKNKRWKRVNAIREAGPIVSDAHLIRLPEMDTEKICVRLRMVQGLWRINMINLAMVVKNVTPQRIVPDAVFRDSLNDESAKRKLLDNNQYLITFPGDVYDISYPVFYKKSYEYFIESQGYYIEWMREEWLIDENLSSVRKMLLHPSAFLKRMAPYYKLHEAEMENIFWNSRYTKN